MKRKIIIATLVVAFIAAVLATESRWEGTDDTVTGSLANQAGVKETRILPWRLDGDLLLFVFCAGGAIAGFAVGYCWRELFGGKAPEMNEGAVHRPAAKSRETL